MKFKGLLLIFIILLITLVSISSVCAYDSSEIDNSQLLSDDSSLDVQSNFQDNNLTGGNVIVVDDFTKYKLPD